MLGELPRKEKFDSGLDLTRAHGGPLVVLSKTTGLGSNSSEQIISEGVEDAHGLGGDPSVGVDLLENPVDEDAVRLLPSLPLLLVSLGEVSNIAGHLGGFSRNLGRHDATLVSSGKLSEHRWTDQVFMQFWDSGGGRSLSPLIGGGAAPLRPLLVGGVKKENIKQRIRRLCTFKF